MFFMLVSFPQHEPMKVNHDDFCPVGIVQHLGGELLVIIRWIADPVKKSGPSAVSRPAQGGSLPGISGCTGEKFPQCRHCQTCNSMTIG